MRFSSIWMSSAVIFCGMAVFIEERSSLYSASLHYHSCPWQTLQPRDLHRTLSYPLTSALLTTFLRHCKVPTIPLRLSYALPSMVPWPADSDTTHWRVVMPWQFKSSNWEQCSGNRIRLWSGPHVQAFSFWSLSALIVKGQGPWNQDGLHSLCCMHWQAFLGAPHQV